jgi:hypothetical protein
MRPEVKVSALAPSALGSRICAMLLIPTPTAQKQLVADPGNQHRSPRFTKPPSTRENSGLPSVGARITVREPSTPPAERKTMSSSGELIRLINYVDDISSTLRRIKTASAFIASDEKKRLAEYMRNADPNYLKLIEAMERGD